MCSLGARYLIFYIQVLCYVCNVSGFITRFSSDDSLCCDDQLYNRTDFYPYSIKCCKGNNKMYRDELEFCCGSEIRQKMDLGYEYGCCEESNRPYKKSGEDGLCCDGVFHEARTYEKYGCCGNKTYQWSKQICCASVIHTLRDNMECCQTELYNVTTHECIDDVIMPKYIRYCGKYQQIDIRLQICCRENPYNKGDINNLMCCGSRPFAPDTQDCVRGDIVPRGHLPCGYESYNPKSKDCCNGVIHSKSSPTEFCCGNQMIDYNTNGCCGTNALAFNKLNQKCCGGMVLDASEKCCGNQKLNPKTEVCCPAILGYNEHKLQKGIFQTKCCPNRSGGQAYDHITHICTRQGEVKPKPNNVLMCGREIYNPDDDLCCNYKLYKNYVATGLKCCLPGTYVYNPKTHSCHNGVPKAVRRNSKCPYTCKKKRLKAFVSKHDCESIQFFIVKKTTRPNKWIIRRGLTRDQPLPQSMQLQVAYKCACLYSRYRKFVAKVDKNRMISDLIPYRKKYVKKILRRQNKICR